MNRILVLGGYGGFGARIARRLVAAGHVVLVAGRSARKAKDFCAADPRLVALQLDRADIAQALAAERPALVVDASGPFQAMDYRVPRACIEAGIHYCDIADGRDFVCGIAALDAAAKAAGVAVISGCSSVPALSGAAARELAHGMDRVRAVEIAISASNKATAGPAVAAAILGQVGRPFKIHQGGRWIDMTGWQGMTRLTFTVPGTVPVSRRLVAMLDVPDLQLLPARLCGRPAVTFRAGTELAMQNRALWFTSRLVRWGGFGGLPRLARWLLPLQALTGALGSDRSAMMVRLFGDRRAARMERRWTLIAEKGDGPEIPALSVPLLAARMLAGEEAPGARDAGEALDLMDYEPAFGGLAIRHACAEIPAPPPLYRRVMGVRYDGLPDSVRLLHDVFREGAASGEASVSAPDNWLGGIVARLMGFPPPGHHPVHVRFSERDGVETWTRTFGGHSFSSRLSQSGAQLVERFGPMRFRFDLPSDSTGLRMEMRGWSVLGLPMPLMLAPRSAAREYDHAGRFHFDVPVRLPLVGRIVHYSGWLCPI